MARPPTPAAASSSSASPPLAGVIEALSKISADGLTILILQQPTVGRAICQALRIPAHQALADVVSDDGEDVKASQLSDATFAQALDILEEAVSSFAPAYIQPDLPLTTSYSLLAPSSPSAQTPP